MSSGDRTRTNTNKCDPKSDPRDSNIISTRLEFEREIQNGGLRNGARRRFAGQFFLPTGIPSISYFQIELDLRDSISILPLNYRGIPVSRDD